MTALRRVYLALLAAGPLILMVLVILMPFGEPAIGLAIVLALIGITSLVASRWAWSRQLKTDSPEELLRSFNSVFFLAFAFGEYPMLATFVASFVVDGYWPFLIGLASFLWNMARIAPTAGHLEEKDRELTTRGSRYLLTEVLSTRRPRGSVPR